ncbi:MAG TPA: hypothetical protein VEF53_18890 [Patescibacteria group bacterium]|nr:hypothetical protein [Patescibacteria group bacterium]
MLTITVVGCGTVIILALGADPKQTTQLVTAIITIRGITFIAKRITQTINRDASDMVNFVGWSIAGVSMVKLLKLSYQGVTPFISTVTKISNGIQGFAEWMDKLTPWS